MLKHGNERDKSAPELTKLWIAMAKAGLDRTSAVVALGGGVVGDAAGFAAATYMRGISLIQVPTTLLAQVDSSIGGKTAIDLPEGKNLVGAFYQPRLVISDINTLKTLPFKEFRNSFAEVVKYGVIRDAGLFNLLEAKTNWFFLSLKRGIFNAPQRAFLEAVVSRSAAVKAKVIERDEFERKGERMILNYGHTFGHALEANSRYRMPHGEAVAIGMTLAARLASKLKLFKKKDELRQAMLLRSAGLPIKARFQAHRILTFMKRDKKARAGRIRLILPKAIGRVETSDRISEREIRILLQEFGSSS